MAGRQAQMNDARQILNPRFKETKLIQARWNRGGGGGGAITHHILVDLETKPVSSKDFIILLAPQMFTPSTVSALSNGIY
jgi:hypothetical protein